MKRQLLALIISFFFCNYIISQNCEKLLEDGLYSFTKMTNTNSFGKDFRSYYLSDQFKSDMKSGKWGASLTIPIKSKFFTINTSDKDERFSELHTKILEISELKIEQNDAQVLLQSLPNTNLYEAYVKCQDIQSRQGFSGLVQGTNVETEDAVVFTIYYKPSSPMDPMPTVTNFNVIPSESVISGGLKIGDSLKGFTTLITCKRPNDTDLIMSLETDRGGLTSKASAKDNIISDKDIPIGSILTSYLNFEQFNAATKNNDRSPGGIWTSQKSKWAPCDGRPVPSSKFQKLTSQNSIPDLRGMFIRGLNRFDPYQPVPDLDITKADPEWRIVGSFQSDAIKDHTHQVHYQQGRRNASNGGNGNHRVTDEEITTQNKTEKCYECENETRPKNVAVYYYIRIN